MTIIVLDGQGGGIGRAIITALLPKLPEGVQLLCVGTNAMATAAMRRNRRKRRPLGGKERRYPAGSHRAGAQGFHDGRNHRRYGGKRRLQLRRPHPHSDRTLRHTRCRRAEHEHADTR